MGVTRNIVPRVNEDGQIGVSNKKWDQCHFKDGYFDNITLDGTDLLTLIVQLGVPTGVVFAWPHDNVPTGYLECNGAGLSTTTYVNLFNIIKYRYGGSGSTFYLPDYRGYFLRGHDAGRGVDPERTKRLSSLDGRPGTLGVNAGVAGDNIGTVQGHMYQNHNHVFGGDDMIEQAGFVRVSSWNYDAISSYSGYGGRFLTWNSGGSETRPINVYVKWIIKY